MKLLSSSIAVLSAVSGLSTSGCKDGVYPHEYKCDSYYQCANGHRYEDQKCPDNLLFNAETLKCDYPSAVECPTFSYKKCFYECRKNGGRVFSCKKECAQYISKPEKPTDAPTTTTQKPTEKPKKCKDGIYLEPGTCDKYYQCENGVKYPPQDCPPGLDFNEAAGYCDWPQNVGCSVKPTPAPTEPAPEKPEFDGCFLSCRKSGKSKIKCLKECFGNEKPSNECPQGDGIFGDPEKCNEFYMCHHGHRFENQECPEPLLFSEETKQCEHPAEVECANKPKYCEDGIYPVPGICNAFYQCSNGIWWDKQYCPDGLLFNPEVDVCDWPENVECDGQKEDGCYISCRKNGQSKLVCAKKCLFSGNDGGNKPKVCPEDGIFRDPEDCSKFYHCTDGIKSESQQCPSGLLFSEVTERCEYPAYVKCDDKPKYCKDGIYPVPGICNAFYQCSNGIWWDKQYCPDGLLFNPEIEVCDWPENVECKESDQNPAKCYFACRKAGGKIFECGKKCKKPIGQPEPEKCADGIYPVPNQCNVFYQCANGHRYENQYCPEPLLFSSITDQCEHPRDVLSERDDCGDIEYCEDGIYPIPGCSGFFTCSNGIQWETQYCPGNLLFNKDEGVCDWPKNVDEDCNGVTPEPTSAPTPEPCKLDCVVRCMKEGGDFFKCMKTCKPRD